MTITPNDTSPRPGWSVQDCYNALLNIINDRLVYLNPSNVQITGGTINGTTIGQSVPAAGAFTTLTGTSGSINGDGIVTLTASQTLTNKALTAPGITGGTLTSAIINATTIGQTTPAVAAFTTVTATSFNGVALTTGGGALSFLNAQGNYVTAGGGDNVIIANVAQTSHGFSVGNAIYFNGTSYVLARADTASAAEAVGVVSTIVDANTFSYTTSGRITGLSGLTAGGVYFLSDITAGLLTLTQPTTSTSITKPMLIALSTTIGLLVNYRGVVVGSSGGSSAIVRSVNSISSPTTAGAVASTDYVYFVSGTTTLTLPTAVGNTNRYTIKNTGGATVTIATTSSQTIDGSTTATLAVQNTALDLISDGSNWRIV